MQRAKILIVDDEKDILELLQYNLQKEDYEVKTSKNGEDAVKLAKSFRPDLIILDIMMPQMDGIEVCGVLREIEELDNTLIAFLTARSESFTHITALEAGGDDYITKPIKPNVLKSRIKALLRRHPDFKNEKSMQKLHFGDLIVDLEEFTVHIDSNTITLAKKEFELLKLLISKPGKVFKRLEILQKVWGSNVIVGDRTIDVHVRKLREKIGSNYILTLKGVGYKFNY